MSNAAMIIYGHFFLYVVVLISLGYIPKSGIYRHF